MDTRFVETFLIVAERKSMAAAAQRLNLTPAAVAQRMKALEDELGTKLLSRSGRVVRPTEAGFKILEHARTLIRESATLKAVANSRTMGGELRIGSINTALSALMPDMLERLSNRHPSIEVFIRPGVSMDLYDEVLGGTLDAAFIIEPRFAIPKTIQFQPLRQEPMVLLAPESRGAGAPLDLLATEPFIRYDRRHWGGHLADLALKQTGVQPNERYELDSLETIAIMVDRGLGVSIVPDWPPPWPAGLRLARLQLPNCDLKRTIGVVLPVSSPKQHLIKAFLDACVAVTT